MTQQASPSAANQARHRQSGARARLARIGNAMPRRPTTKTARRVCRLWRDSCITDSRIHGLMGGLLAARAFGDADACLLTGPPARRLALSPLPVITSDKAQERRLDTGWIQAGYRLATGWQQAGPDAGGPSVIRVAGLSWWQRAIANASGFVCMEVCSSSCAPPWPLRKGSRCPSPTQEQCRAGPEWEREWALPLRASEGAGLAGRTGP